MARSRSPRTGDRFSPDSPATTSRSPARTVRSSTASNKQGRHLETRDTLAGATLYSFEYEPSGALKSISDGDGNVTRVERNGHGAVTGIVAPFGKRTDADHTLRGARTLLTLDPNGYPATVTNPENETWYVRSRKRVRGRRTAGKAIHQICTTFLSSPALLWTHLIPEKDLVIKGPRFESGRRLGLICRRFVGRPRRRALQRLSGGPYMGRTGLENGRSGGPDNGLRVALVAVLQLRDHVRVGGKRHGGRVAEFGH
jgi:YD repeat-containing protein